MKNYRTWNLIARFLVTLFPPEKKYLSHLRRVVAKRIEQEWYIHVNNWRPAFTVRQWIVKHTKNTLQSLPLAIWIVLLLFTLQTQLGDAETGVVVIQIPFGIVGASKSTRNHANANVGKVSVFKEIRSIAPENFRFACLEIQMDRFWSFLL